MSFEDKETWIGKTFTQARTHYYWQDKAVEDTLLKEIYEIAKFGPTSANCCPLRILFIKSAEAKEKLKPALDAGNVEKTLSAPVTAIFAYDLEFYKELPFLFPHVDAKSWFVGNQPLIQEYAFRSATLQAAYFMIAARALGLDCGPMSGFNSSQVDEVFFPNSSWRSNFLCNLGYGQPARLHPRLPRLDFSPTCQII